MNSAESAGRVYKIAKHVSEFNIFGLLKLTKQKVSDCKIDDKIKNV